MMASLRTLLVLSLVAAASAAPAGQQVAGQSHHEAADSAPRHTDAVPIDTGDPDVTVSVATSTSMEITTVMSSVSSEMGPMPASPGVAEAEKAAGDVTPPLGDVTLNEIEDAGAEEAAKAGEDRPETVDMSSSVSMQMTQTKMTVSEAGEPSGDGADVTEAVPGPAADAAAAEEGSGVGGEVESRTQILSDDAGDVEGSGAEADLAEGSGAADDEGSGDNTTKGTLIFDLGEGATDELHDLVQQTVLEALMEEGLLAASDDLTPAIQAEGSGIVFSDGSGEGEDLGGTTPFVSIHF